MNKSQEISDRDITWTYDETFFVFLDPLRVYRLELGKNVQHDIDLSPFKNLEHLRVLSCANVTDQTIFSIPNKEKLKSVKCYNQRGITSLSICKLEEINIYRRLRNRRILDDILDKYRLSDLLQLKN